MPKESKHPEVTVPWLREQVLDLFQEARDAEKRDHAVCQRYLEFLFKMVPGMEREAPSVPQKPAAGIRDALWQQQSEKKNGVTPTPPATNGSPRS